jgi:hypothetical protein
LKTALVEIDLAGPRELSGQTRTRVEAFVESLG